MGRKILELDKVRVTYKQKFEKHVLDDVSFSLKEGQILGLVGESGSGKSTCAYAIMRLLPENSSLQGRILFEGKNIYGYSPQELVAFRGREIGLISQDPSWAFNPVLSIGYQIREFFESKGVPSRGSKFYKNIDTIFKKVKLSDSDRILKSYPYQLSGGQLQRIMIALTVAVRPQVLIADEPTSSLDVTVESKIINLLKSLRKEYYFTILFISHNLKLVSVLCDTIVVLYKGKVQEEIASSDLFTQAKQPYTQQLISAHQDLERITEGKGGNK